jgi:hypothetical protein
MTRSTRKKILASLISVAFVGAMVVPGMPVGATQVQSSELRANGWVSSAETPAPATPCNYLYVDFGANLLYYGTSGNCGVRLAQHDRDGRDVSEMYLLFQGSLPPEAFATLRPQILTWALQADGTGASADACLAINTQRGVLSIWYLPLSTRADSLSVEGCVLARSMGYCNRQGAGITTGSWMQFRTSIQTCVRQFGG